MRLYQDINDFNNKLVNIINFISIEGKTNVIGSSNLKPIRYNSDYDLSTEIKGELNLKNKLYKRFLQVFKDSKKDKNIFIADFKCGETENGEPIRWDYNDMIKGFKIIDDVKYFFEDCLTHKSTIKIDVIYLLNNKFVEMSDNYYIKIGNKTNFDKITKESIIKSLEEDYKDLIQEGKYYKALKREFSMIELQNNKNKLTNRQKELIDYFNSDLGILNKGKGDLELLLILLEIQKFRKVKLEDIRNNLQIIKQNISYSLDVHLSDKLNKATKSNKTECIKIIKNIITNLENYINTQTKNDYF
jgi:hypothetical protein